MHVERDNVFARVTRWDDPGERVWVSRVLTYGAAKRGPWSKPTEAFNVFDDSFLAGLLPDVLKAAATDAVTVTTTDLRGPRVYTDTDVDLGWLDDLQRDAVSAFVTRGRGIVKMPTGAGKTEVFVALALIYSRARVGFFAPREQLATQAAERWALRTDGAPHGLFTKGRHDLTKRVTFATFQSVAKHMHRAEVIAWLSSLDVIVCDEVHTVAARTFLPVLSKCTNARVRGGLSATPLDRTDERVVHTVGAIGPVVHEVETQQVVASGRIVPARVIMADVRQYITGTGAAPTRADRDGACARCGAEAGALCDPFCDAGDDDAARTYGAAYDALVVNSTLRNEVLLALTLAAPKPALVSVTREEHGRVFAAALTARSCRDVPFVFGETTGRADIAAALNDGRHDIAVATTVWDSGVDMPRLRTVVNAAGGKSPIRIVQVLGRAVRATDGKTACTVIDVNDLGEPVLARHASARAKVYAREGWAVSRVSPAVAVHMLSPAFDALTTPPDPAR